MGKFTGTPYRHPKGVSGNPQGFDSRRRRVIAKFTKSVLEKWQEHGDQVLDDLARNNPAKFVDVMISFMPKEMAVEHTHDIAVSWVQAIQALPPAHQMGLERKDTVVLEGQQSLELEAPEPERKE